MGDQLVVRLRTAVPLKGNPADDGERDDRRDKRDIGFVFEAQESDPSLLVAGRTDQ